MSSLIGRGASPLIIPMVSVWSSPNGLPIAYTDCPTCSSPVLATFTGFSMPCAHHTPSWHRVASSHQPRPCSAAARECGVRGTLVRGTLASHIQSTHTHTCRMHRAQAALTHSPWGRPP